MNARARLSEKADEPAMVRALARAFDDDPALNWVVRQDERRRWAIDLLFRRVVAVYRRFGCSYTTEGGGGAAVWAPPGRWDPPAWRMLTLAPDFVKIARVSGLSRLTTTMDTVKARHPREPHYYLYFLGVDPDHQHRGLGGEILAAHLARCDEDKLPAYLENSKEENLAFYRRYGFELREKFAIGPGGPPMWAMWRDSR